MKKIGVVDTAYSRCNMAKVILRTFESLQRVDFMRAELVCATVLDYEELAVGALQLLEH